MHTEESKKNNLGLASNFRLNETTRAGLVLRLTQRNGSVRYETECSEIVYSVRIGPSQPKNSFLSAISTNPATIRIDNPPSGRGIDKLGVFAYSSKLY
jgi:hypothetical protein